MRNEQKEQSTITVDTIVLRVLRTAELPPDLQVALIKRPKMPYQGYWVVPGGHVNKGETFEQAAEREWEEETHAEPVVFVFIGVFGEPERDERGRYVSMLFFGMAGTNVELHTNLSASEVGWFSVFSLPPIGFDHKTMILRALNYLLDKLTLTADLLNFLPGELTLSEVATLLQRIMRLLATVDDRLPETWSQTAQEGIIT